MKEKYLKPIVELTILDKADVIATSGDTPLMNPLDLINQRVHGEGYDW